MLTAYWCTTPPDWRSVFMCSERHGGLWGSLLEVKGTPGQSSYFHQRSFDKRRRRTTAARRLPAWVVTDAEMLMKRRERTAIRGGERRRVGWGGSLWQLKNYHFINSMQYLYSAHILFWRRHLQWPWVITLMSERMIKCSKGLYAQALSLNISFSGLKCTVRLLAIQIFLV